MIKKNKRLNLINRQIFFPNHPYHLVSPSPWPLLTSFSLLALTISGVLSMHVFSLAINIVKLALIVLVCSMTFWFKDVVIESTYQGYHTLAVQKGLSLGFGLFIISEIFFFLAIFWTYFHSALSPTIELGAQWPPMGVNSINPLELPLLNTILLLSSGVTVTFAHHSLIRAYRDGTLIGLFYTIILAIFFTVLQGIEYAFSSFTLSDGIFGSSFYFGTGFHGFHVIIGTIFIIVGLWRISRYHLSENHHLGFESSILYWHFVDIVWIFLYFSVYFWGA